MPGQTGSSDIDQTAKTIDVEVPNGTDVTALVATFTTDGDMVKVGNTKQTSGTTANNFTSPKNYRVYDVNGESVTYVVTVTVASE